MLNEFVKKAVLEILTGQAVENTATEKKSDFFDLMGKFVLIRAHRAGVNVGYLTKEGSDFLELGDSRKLWRWDVKEGNDGVALECVAKHGLKQDGTRATATVEKYYVRKDDICGIMTVDDPEIIEQIKNISCKN